MVKQVVGWLIFVFVALPAISVGWRALKNPRHEQMRARALKTLLFGVLIAALALWLVNS